MHVIGLVCVCVCVCVCVSRLVWCRLKDPGKFGREAGQVPNRQAVPSRTDVETSLLRGRGFAKDSLRGSSVNIGTIQTRLAWPLRKNDTHKSRSRGSANLGRENLLRAKMAVAARSALGELAKMSADCYFNVEISNS